MAKNCTYMHYVIVIYSLIYVGIHIHAHILLKRKKERSRFWEDTQEQHDKAIFNCSHLVQILISRGLPRLYKTHVTNTICI